MAVCQQHHTSILVVTSSCDAKRHIQLMVWSRWTLSSARLKSVKNIMYGQCPLDMDDLKVKVIAAFTHVAPEMLNDTVRTGLLMWMLCSRVGAHRRGNVPALR
jgi:hypothetical protein